MKSIKIAMGIFLGLVLTAYTCSEKPGTTAKTATVATVTPKPVPTRVVSAPASKVRFQPMVYVQPVTVPYYEPVIYEEPEWYVAPPSPGVSVNFYVEPVRVRPIAYPVYRRPVVYYAPVRPYYYCPPGHQKWKHKH